MNKFLACIAILGLLAIMASGNKNEPANRALPKVKAFVINELSGIGNDLNVCRQNLTNTPLLKQLYYSSRKHYKHCEFFIEYCSPREAKFYLNGPLVSKYDADFGAGAFSPQGYPGGIFSPQGFQRIEELLFDSEGRPDTAELAKEYNSLSTHIASIAGYYKILNVQDAQVLDMFQLELVRIAAMNLSGYDATILQNNVTEALWSIEGLEKGIAAFKAYTENAAGTQSAYIQLKRSINEVKKFLKSNTNYDAFNRLEFITKQITPLNRELIAFHHACGLPWIDRPSALNLQQGFLFGEKAFNKQYFSIYYNDTVNLKEQAALGKKLFNEPLLSGNNLNSCSSCHKPELAFTDGKPKSIDLNHQTGLTRNAPSLINVIYQTAFFHDGRAYQLEQQIFDVIHNVDEMNGTLDDAVLKLQEKPLYQSLFKHAFKGSRDTTITPYAIQKAITEYEKTLVSFDSRFDSYLTGNAGALTKEEINGYNLFAGKAMCGSCHFFPLFNGTVPAFYSDTEFEVIGVPKSADNKELDDDPGRFNVTKQKIHWQAFKTPTVRNIALTAPYMHNGVYTTLEEVVEFYHKGGGVGLGFSLPNQTLPFDSLKLNAIEKKEIVAFMNSLTDKKYLKQKHAD